MTPLQGILGVANLGGAALVAALAVPLVRRRVKRNAFYGVRFARSMESDELWYDINAYGGRRMLFWSAFVALAGIACFFVPLEGHPVRTIALSCASLVYVIAAVESYRYGSRLP